MTETTITVGQAFVAEMLVNFRTECTNIYDLAEEVSRLASNISFIRDVIDG